MAEYKFRLPDVGEGVSEGEIVAWHVTPGQQIAEDAPMVEVMTDKATVMINSPRAGVVRELCAKVGQVVNVGSVVIVIDTPGAADSRVPPASSAAASSAAANSEEIEHRDTIEDVTRLAEIAMNPEDFVDEPTYKSNGVDAHLASTAKTKTPSMAPKTAPAGSAVVASAVGDIRESLPGVGLLPPQNRVKTAENRPIAAANGNGYFKEKPLATPATRKLARDMGVDLRHVAPSGPSGRVTNDDVHRAAALSVPSTQGRVNRWAGGPREERRPFVGLRRKIAERLHTAKQRTAHFTFVEECNADRLVEVRERLGGEAEQRGVKLTFLPFIVKAVVRALQRHPIINSELDEGAGELVLKRYAHIGIATATDEGLIVPVLRDADRRGLWDLAREIDRLAQAARTRSLKAEETRGSTFTITSLGRAGGLLATPVLNYPEVGILGVHQIKERPVVRDGAIVIGRVMNLSLSLDHRIVDGHTGAAFVYDVIGYLEEPARLFIDD